MKIEKIILKNFSAIKNAMETNELTIDFSESKNNICLIIGPNGSGKTTLMSLLTPFSGLGNLDIRDGNELILEKKDGYKEIHIRDNDDYFIIKHFYTPHEGKSHSVKSYLLKNGVELNINGNVTSFKEYVKEELGIELDYLKLIRLGSNVTSMIDLSETERKAFMSKLLDEIGVSLTYYKKVNNDLRQLKQMISLNVNKLDRLGIEDKEIVEEEIEKLEKEEKDYRNYYDVLSGKISVLQHEIEKIEDGVYLKDKLSSTLKKIKKMDKILERKNELESTDVEYYTLKIDELTKEKIRLEYEIQTSNLLIQNHLDSLNQSMDQLQMILVRWDKEKESDRELQKMEEELKNLRKEINQRSSFEDFHPNYTKEEIDKLVVFLKNTQQVLDRTYEFGKKPIKKVIGILREKRNVMNYINSSIMNLDGTSEEENTLLLRKLQRSFNFEKEDFSKCPDKSCPAYNLWIQIRNLTISHEEENEKKEDYDFYRDMESCYQNIKTVLLSFSEYDSLINRLPKKIQQWFLLDHIYTKIENLEKIYNEKELHDFLATITEYEDTIRMKEQYDTLKETIDRFTKLSNFSYLSEMKENLEEEIEDKKEQLTELKRKLSDDEEHLKETNLSLESMEELKETFEKYDELHQLSIELETKYNLYRENTKAIHDTRVELSECQKSIDKLTEKIQSYKNALSQYVILKKELNHFNQIFDEMTLVKEALSSKKGMPLYQIKHYLGNTEEITNELLDIAYDGQIYIDKFHITPTEFRIPFYNKGKKLKDVKFASQGELSFLSIALSFGLSSQSLSKYNIMLLDEIDGPLDSKNREKFIRILENQIARIGSEQNFLITHNNMFSSYPVDIIDLSFQKERTTEYELANFIPVTRS